MKDKYTLDLRRASLLDPDDVYIKPDTSWHSVLVATASIIAAGFLIYAVTALISLII